MRFARLRVVAPLLAGVLGFAFFAFGRDYPFHLALLMGAALLFLAFAAVRTFQQIGDLGRRDSPDRRREERE